MTKRYGLVVLCFVAGLFGAMIGNDLSAPVSWDNNSAELPVEYVANTGAVNRSSTYSLETKTTNPVINAIKRVGPAVVNIDTVVMRRTSIFGFSDPFSDMFGDDSFSRLVPSSGQGSGFIIDGVKGYVLTNEHVIHDAVAGKGKIKVSLPNKETYEATVIGSDPQYDVAILKIDGKNLPSVPLGSSNDIVIGEWAIAIGNPFGFRNTVTLGVVSALDRTLDTNDSGRLEGLIQTDAAINPGNSGGPLCDIDGNIIGINTAIFNKAEGLGFSISSSSIKPVVSEIIKYGRVRHGWSGMTFWDISQRLASRLDLESTDGALVAEVYNDSPADKSGIKPGDVVLEAGKKKITCVADVQDVLREARAGENLSLTLARKGKKVDIKIQLAEIPERQNIR